MGTGRRIASNFVWASASELIGKGTFVAVNIYIARVLGAGSFGLYSLAQAVTSSLWLVVDLGVNVYGIREIAKNREHAESVINPLLTMRVTIGVAAFAIYALVLLLSPISSSERLAFLASALFILTYSFYTDWVAKGFEEFKYLVFGILLSSIAFASGVILLVRKPADLLAAVLVWSLSYLVGSISLLFILSRRLKVHFRPSFHIRTWRMHIRECKHFMFSGVLLVLYENCPLYLLGYFATKELVGLFSAPSRIIVTINNAGFLITAAFYPALSQAFKGDIVKFRQLRKNLGRIMVAISLPAAIVGTLFAHDITLWVLGPQYMQSQTVLAALIWLVPLRYGRASFGSALLASGFQRSHNVASLTGLLSFLGLGFALIPARPLVGASLALLAAESLLLAAMMGAYWYSVGRHYKAYPLKQVVSHD